MNGCNLSTVECLVECQAGTCNTPPVPSQD